MFMPKVGSLAFRERSAAGRGANDRFRPKADPRDRLAQRLDLGEPWRARLSPQVQSVIVPAPSTCLGRSSVGQASAAQNQALAFDSARICTAVLLGILIGAPSVEFIR
jgi:hypothetical protein